MMRGVVDQKQNDFWVHELRIANFTKHGSRITKHGSRISKNGCYLFFVRPSFLNLSLRAASWEMFV